MLSFEINNGRKMVVSQLHQNGDVEIWTGKDMQCDNNYDIPAGDFVMLLNYYRHIKDNNIQNDFINPHGASREV